MEKLIISFSFRDILLNLMKTEKNSFENDYGNGI